MNGYKYTILAGALSFAVLKVELKTVTYAGFMQFHIIETQRLKLKRLGHDDFIYIFNNWQKPEIKRFFGHRNEEEYRLARLKFEKGYVSYNRSILFFLIIDKFDDCVIGECSFHNWYPDHRRAELGYSIKTDAYKNKGLMSEALAAVIAYGFNEMNLHRIEALVGTRNVPSLRLVEKFGFSKEGVLKEHYFINGQYEDSAVFGLLKSDYGVNAESVS
ncbi:GNAT family N-acetyltransferase [Pedobacter deserti]|uniref:GNAT family N-acetyltransferase n=1 Tax=Pedobacter deserti TaxID=2817382 RepID=UPI00210CCF22